MKILHIFLIGLILGKSFLLVAAESTSDINICLDIDEQNFAMYTLKLNELGMSKTLQNIWTDLEDTIDARSKTINLGNDIPAADLKKYFIDLIDLMVEINDNNDQETKKRVAEALKKRLKFAGDKCDDLIGAANLSNYLETPLLPLVEDIIAENINEDKNNLLFESLYIDIQRRVTRKVLMPIFDYLKNVHITLLREIKPVFDIFSMAYSPDGKQIALGGTAIKIWDVSTGKILRDLEGHSSTVHSIVYSQDGKQIASGSDDKTIKIWDVGAGKVLRDLKGHSGHVKSIAYSPDGKQIASGSSDKTVKIWDVNTGKVLRDLKGHSCDVYSIAYSPDGKQIASGSNDKTVKIWDVSTGEVLGDLEIMWNCKPTRPQVTCIVYSPDGKQIALSSKDKKDIKVFDTSTYKLKTTLSTKNTTRSIAYNPNSTLIVSSCTDTTIRLWDAETLNKDPLHTIKKCHARALKQVVYSPDGGQIASVANGNSLKIWRLGVVPGDQLTLALILQIKSLYANRLSDPKGLKCFCSMSDQLFNSDVSSEMRTFLQPLLCLKHQNDTTQKGDDSTQPPRKKRKITP